MFEEARRKYRPETVNILLIAEAPPRIESRRFFYFENVRDQDSLYLETMKVIYPGDYIDTRYLSENKADFLNRFKLDGYYLLDAANTTIRDIKKKKEQLRADLPDLIGRINRVINQETKIILISRPVYDVCFMPLKTAAFNVINTEMIDFPGSGGQVKYRNKMNRLLTGV